MRADMALADWLALARELAQAAKGSEDRSRGALYAAIAILGAYLTNRARR